MQPAADESQSHMPRVESPNRPGPLSRSRHESRALVARLACAVCIGLLVVLVSGLEYEASARLEVAGSLDAARSALLDFTWRNTAACENPADWRVDRPDGPSPLTLHLRGEDATQTELRLRELVGEFQSHLATLVETAQRRNQEIAGLLNALLTEFAAAAEIAENSARQSEADVPDQSPFDALRTLSTRIHEQIAVLDRLRTAEAGAQATLQRLQDPVNVSNLITPQQRESAYQATTELQQDLAQLAMQLTLGKDLLLAIWQETSPDLDELVAAASRQLQATYAPTGRIADEDYLERLDQYRQRLGHYQQRVVAFAEQWTQAFTSLKSKPVEPMRPRLMDTHRRLKDLLGDFFHHGGRLLEAMRDDVIKLGDHSNPSRQRLTSGIKRSFQRLESTHRQFELAASNIHRRNNFRLDAAVDSASGLHRRVRHTVAQIDARLEEEALARARTERAATNDSVLQSRESIRRDINAAADRIIELYSEYAATVPEAEGFLRPMISAELARRQLADAEQRLEKCGAIAERLRAIHKTGAETPSVRLVKTSVGVTPASVTSRTLMATLAGALTLAATGYITRRRKTAAESRLGRPNLETRQRLRRH